MYTLVALAADEISLGRPRVRCSNAKYRGFLSCILFYVISKKKKKPERAKNGVSRRREGFENYHRPRISDGGLDGCGSACGRTRVDPRSPRHHAPPPHPSVSACARQTTSDQFGPENGTRTFLPRLRTGIPLKLIWFRETKQTKFALYAIRNNTETRTRVFQNVFQQNQYTMRFRRNRKYFADQRRN